MKGGCAILLNERIYRVGGSTPIRENVAESKIHKVDKSTCLATVTVLVAPTFFGWLAQFGDKMQIIEPESERGVYAMHITSALGQEDQYGRDNPSMQPSFDGGNIPTNCL